MRICLHLGYVPADQLLAVAVEAERLGYDAISLPEHVIYPGGAATPYPYRADGRIPWTVGAPWLDPFVTAAAIAARTERVELLTAVFVMPLRHPLLVAKAMATLDGISGGRFALGVGVGWMREEYMALGIPFEERGARLDEAIEVLRAALSGRSVSYRGRYYEFDELSMSPAPGHMRVLGGGTSPGALRRSALLCDGFMTALNTPQDIVREVREVRRLREEAGLVDEPFEIVGAAYGMGNIDDQMALESEGVTALRVYPFPELLAGREPATVSLEERIDVITRYYNEVVAPTLGSPR